MRGYQLLKLGDQMLLLAIIGYAFAAGVIYKVVPAPPNWNPVVFAATWLFSVPFVIGSKIASERMGGPRGS